MTSDTLLKNYETYKINTAFWQTLTDKSSNEEFIKYYLNLYYSSWALYIKLATGMTNMTVNFTIPLYIHSNNITSELKEHVTNINMQTELPSLTRSLSEQIHAEFFDKLIYQSLKRMLNDLNNILFNNIFKFNLKTKHDKTIIINFESTHVIGHFTFHTYDPHKSSDYVRSCHLVHEFFPDDYRGRLTENSKKYYNFIILDNKVNYIIDPINDNLNMVLVAIFFAVVLNLLINQETNTLTIHNYSD